MPTPPTQISNASVVGGIVYLNDRVTPDHSVFWNVPAGRLFVVTDLIVQNRAPGDLPVGANDFTRFAVTSPSGQDTFYHVVGNTTLSAHFTTGYPISDLFRFLNIINSSAAFAEFVITGYLRDKD